MDELPFEPPDSAFSEQVPSLITIYRWFKEFKSEMNSVQEHSAACSYDCY